jgi:hypothetical protein
MLRNGILFATLLLAASAFGAEVLRVGRDHQNIAISHGDSRHWQVDDRVCVFHGSTKIVCGTVLKTTPKGAIAKLESSNSDILAGDEIRAGGTRRPTALLATTETGSEGRPSNFDITGGLSFSYSFFFPMINFQVALAPNFAIGLTPLYLKTTGDLGSLGAFGGYLTLNYYGSEYFRGMWIAAGAGALMFSGDDGFTPTQSATSPAFTLTLGWRGYWDLGLNIGVGAGVQYISKPNFVNLDVSAAGVQPLLIVDVGFNF